MGREHFNLATCMCTQCTNSASSYSMCFMMVCYRQQEARLTQSVCFMMVCYRRQEAKRSMCVECSVSHTHVVTVQAGQMATFCDTCTSGIGSVFCSTCKRLTTAKPPVQCWSADIAHSGSPQQWSLFTYLIWWFTSMLWQSHLSTIPWPCFKAFSDFILLCMLQVIKNWSQGTTIPSSSSLRLLLLPSPSILSPCHFVYFLLYPLTQPDPPGAVWLFGWCPTLALWMQCEWWKCSENV